MKIKFKKLLSASKKINLKNNPYIQTYPEFVKYFKDCKKINKHNLVIGSHFVYGWMPTILKKLNLDENDKILQLLNKKENLNLEDLIFLKSKINNSMIGLSKLLHFIKPNMYAIYDSRVGRVIEPKLGYAALQNPKNYILYIQELNRIIKEEKDFRIFHNNVNKSVGYKVTPMRAIEIVMFQSGIK